MKRKLPEGFGWGLLQHLLAILIATLLLTLLALLVPALPLVH